MATCTETYDQLRERFVAAVAKHDLTYAYSDDHRHYVAGEKQRREILDLAAQLARADAAAIWNANVDKRIAAPSRADFYWKG